MIFKEIKVLLRKDFLLEWKNKYALNGILLYLLGCIYICYMSFQARAGSMSPITWNALFWIIMLFCAINAVAKSFVFESAKRDIFYYTIASSQAVILSKLIYNIMLMSLLAFLAIIIFIGVLGNPVQDLAFFILVLFTGALSLASGLTLIAAIAGKANGSATLMAILSFPVVLPILLLIIKMSKSAIDGLDRSINNDELLTLWLINIIVMVLSYILYPFIAKE